MILKFLENILYRLESRGSGPWRINGWEDGEFHPWGNDGFYPWRSRGSYPWRGENNYWRGANNQWGGGDNHWRDAHNHWDGGNNQWKGAHNHRGGGNNQWGRAAATDTDFSISFDHGHHLADDENASIGGAADTGAEVRAGIGETPLAGRNGNPISIGKEAGIGPLFVGGSGGGGGTHPVSQEGDKISVGGDAGIVPSSVVGGGGAGFGIGGKGGSG